MIAAELRGGNKPSLNEALGWIGSRVDDIYGANVGRLEDVWIDPGTGVPRWLLVKEGRFGGRTTLIPFEDATAGAGHVWVPYEREIVREAPEIEPGAPLTHQVEAALRSHYAANAPTAMSDRGQPAPPASRQPGSSMGTATVRLHGTPEAGPPSAFDFEGARPQGPAPPPPRAVPQPRRQVLREQPHPGDPAAQRFAAAAIPPVQLPPRPAPPIAAPGPPAPPPPAYAPPPLEYQPRQPQLAYPPQAPAPTPPPRYAPPPAPVPVPESAWESQHRARAAMASPGWQGGYAPPQPPPQPQRAADPIESLQHLAASPDVHYVEIELSGELSIRGELRSVRVVPRGRGPAGR